MKVEHVHAKIHGFFRAVLNYLRFVCIHIQYFIYIYIEHRHVYIGTVEKSIPHGKWFIVYIYIYIYIIIHSNVLWYSIQFLSSLDHLVGHLTLLREMTLASSHQTVLYENNICKDCKVNPLTNPPISPTQANQPPAL